MVRVFQDIIARKCHNGIINPAKGFIGSHSVLFKTANMQIMKVLIYAYTGPKKKGQFQKVWMTRINAALFPPNIKGGGTSKD